MCTVESQKGLGTQHCAIRKELLRRCEELMIPTLQSLVPCWGYVKDVHFSILIRFYSSNNVKL